MQQVDARDSRRFETLAVDPDDPGATITVLIPAHRVQWARKMGTGAILELADSVPNVLLHPGRLYRGIKRDSDDEKAGQHPGWLCYVGKPGRRYDYASGNERSQADRVLMVYVNQGRIVYIHRWEREDALVPGQPEDLDGRFLEQVI